MNDEDMKLYRKRQLEIHEELAKEKLLRADIKLATAIDTAKLLKRKLDRQ